MTQEEIDIKLAAWQSDVLTLHANLSEVKDLIGYQLARDGRELSGKSAEKHKKGVAAETRLWAKFDLFSKLVAKIKDKRDNLPSWGGKAKALEEIRQLFDGDSIELPPEDVAIENRDIFAGSQKVRKLTAKQVRDEMTVDFKLLRDIYVELGDAWGKVGAQLTEHAPIVAKIKEEEAKYGRSDSADISALTSRIESTTRRWSNDPLGVTENIKDDLAPYVRKAQQFVVQLAAERTKITTDLTTAGEKLELLKTRKVRCLEQHQAVLLEVESEQEPKVPPSTRGLSDWLTKCTTLHEEKKWDDCQHNLAEWFRLHERISRETEAAFEFNKGLVEKRSALKTRFLDAVVRYKEYAGKGMEIPKSVVAFTDKGQELLKGKVNLKEAELIINALETKVGELIAEFERQGGKSSS